MYGFQILQPYESAACVVDEQCVTFKIGNTNKFVGGGHERRQHAGKAFVGAKCAQPPHERR